MLGVWLGVLAREVLSGHDCEGFEGVEVGVWIGDWNFVLLENEGGRERGI